MMANLDPFDKLGTPEYSRFIALSRYARWLPEENRRETWDETVDRYFDFFDKHLKNKHDYAIPKKLRKELRDAVYNLDVMPSMRAMMTAGPALERCNVAGFNCSYLPIDHPRAFDELLYILMCGTGVGFSVEEDQVKKLPEVNEVLEPCDTVIVVDDSKQGWAKGLRQLISLLYAGQIPGRDTSKLRPAGARLVTFGGRSSGPEPLEDLFRFVVEVFKEAQGRQLTTIECHDIACKIGEIVVVGGVRRSALISLSDIKDIRLRDAKTGEWWRTEPQRSLANNSAVYSRKPDMNLFFEEWHSLYKSKSGERGIFNRDSVLKHLKYNVPRRELMNGASVIPFGCNPCSEINLRPYQFCNLTEGVLRPNDSWGDIERKVRLATILGTYQSTLTDFKYLRNIWKKNTEEERLLGVSLTGIMDCHGLSHFMHLDDIGEFLHKYKDIAVKTNEEFAKKIGIPQSAAITCVKPSGTVSQLVDSASGIHPRHAPFYIRRVRGDKKDPLTQFMIDKGFPCEDDVFNPHNKVFEFPMAAPKGSLTRADISAIDHLELWKVYQENWCEHKPSATISVKEDEWMKVGSWVYENFDHISGVSFLPYEEHTYQQAPYEEITEEQYQELLQKMPKDVDWTGLREYEKEDTTVGSQEMACAGGFCEIT
jgi:ribonucleoside-diphosphate reductase alpha chain